MTPYTQLIKHDPKRGLYGDCYRTVIGCLLDLRPESVPHFCDGETWETEEEVNKREWRGDVQRWLGQFGLGMITIPYAQADIELVLTTVGRLNPGIYHLLTGKSPRGTNHTVICKDGLIVHDPAKVLYPNCPLPPLVGPCDDGLYWVEFIGIVRPPWVRT